MEQWTKEKTMKLIELMQSHAHIWNSAVCDSRRDKQKRKEQLRTISEYLGLSLADTTKKIQHLRTQYNRELVRETAAVAADPTKMAFRSSWYAYEYLHFLKDSNKPYRIVTAEDQPESFSETNSDFKSPSFSPTPPKVSRSETAPYKPEIIFTPGKSTRDEFSVFGEYVANELRSLKGEKNLLVAKKKIQDAIFEVKMGLISEPRDNTCISSNIVTSLHGGKLYTSPVMSSTSIEPLTHATPISAISEIIINGTSCHYPNFKVDSQ